MPAIWQDRGQIGMLVIGFQQARPPNQRRAFFV